MTVINLNEYREYKAANNMFEARYVELLRCLGTPKTGIGISIVFYCFLRYMQGIINSLPVLNVCGKLEEFELEQLKEQMISCLQDIIKDIKEI